MVRGAHHTDYLSQGTRALPCVCGLIVLYIFARPFDVFAHAFPGVAAA